MHRKGDRGGQRKGSATALSRQVSWEKNAGKLRPSRSHSLPSVPLTIAFEEPVKGGLLASPTEFLSLVHQSLLHSLLSAQHHDAPRAQADGEHWAVALAELRGRRRTVRGGLRVWDTFHPSSDSQGTGHPKIWSFLARTPALTLQKSPFSPWLVRLGCLSIILCTEGSPA